MARSTRNLVVLLLLHAARGVHGALPPNGTRSAAARPSPVAWFARKSVLFLGPANVSCGIDLCWYDAVIITNNMATLLDSLDFDCAPPRRPPRLALVLNNHFSNVVFAQAALLANVSARVEAYLFTNRIKLYEMDRRMRNASLCEHCALGAMNSPAIPGHKQGNTLQYVLKFLRTTSFSSLHITGVTFYEQGQQYHEGYGLIHEAGGYRHDRDANKNYTLEWVRRAGEAFNSSRPRYAGNTTIDYPQCAEQPCPHACAGGRRPPSRRHHHRHGSSSSSSSSSLPYLPARAEGDAAPD